MAGEGAVGGGIGVYVRCRGRYAGQEGSGTHPGRSWLRREVCLTAKMGRFGAPSNS